MMIWKIVTTRILSILFIFISVVSCVEEKPIPKERGYFRINFPEKDYEKTIINCPYTMETPSYTAILNKKDAPAELCAKYIVYPKLKATIYCTYLPVNGDLRDLCAIADKKVYEHKVKATGIGEKVFTNYEKNVFGKAYELSGDVAMNYAFHLTDSVNHFFMGQLYFETAPNYDSLKPCIDFISQDIQHMIETFEWQIPLSSLPKIDSTGL